MSTVISGKAAILGLGIIGSRAFARLQEAGWEVTAWNRSAKGLPGEVATPEAAVSKATIISIYLKDASAVREVMTQIAPKLTAGQVVLNHATVDLETTQWLQELCHQRGCPFLDVPFTGSKTHSADGQLVYYVGGSPDLVNQVEPYLRVTSRALLPCGDVGSATIIKLATNLVSACTLQALAEGLAISVKNGVSAEAFVNAVSQNAHASALSGMKLPMMASGNFETHFSLANMRKDSRYALDLASRANVKTPAIEAVSQRMNDLCDAGLGELDYSAVAKPYLPES